MSLFLSFDDAPKRLSLRERMLLKEQQNIKTAVPSSARISTNIKVETKTIVTPVLTDVEQKQGIGTGVKKDAIQKTISLSRYTSNIGESIDNSKSTDDRTKRNPEERVDDRHSRLYEKKNENLNDSATRDTQSSQSRKVEVGKSNDDSSKSTNLSSRISKSDEGKVKEEVRISSSVNKHNSQSFKDDSDQSKPTSRPSSRLNRLRDDENNDDTSNSRNSIILRSHSERTNDRRNNSSLNESRSASFRMSVNNKSQSEKNIDDHKNVSNKLETLDTNKSEEEPIYRRRSKREKKPIEAQNDENKKENDIKKTNKVELTFNSKSISSDTIEPQSNTTTTNTDLKSNINKESSLKNSSSEIPKSTTDDAKNQRSRDIILETRSNDSVPKSSETIDVSRYTTTDNEDTRTSISLNETPSSKQNEKTNIKVNLSKNSEEIIPVEVQDAFEARSDLELCVQTLDVKVENPKPVEIENKTKVNVTNVAEDLPEKKTVEKKFERKNRPASVNNFKSKFESNAKLFSSDQKRPVSVINLRKTDVNNNDRKDSSRKVENRFKTAEKNHSESEHKTANISKKYNSDVSNDDDNKQKGPIKRENIVEVSTKKDQVSSEIKVGKSIDEKGSARTVNKNIESIPKTVEISKRSNSDELNQKDKQKALVQQEINVDGNKKIEIIKKDQQQGEIKIEKRFEEKDGTKTESELKVEKTTLGDGKYQKEQTTRTEKKEIKQGNRTITQTKTETSYKIERTKPELKPANKNTNSNTRQSAKPLSIEEKLRASKKQGNISRTSSSRSSTKQNMFKAQINADKTLKLQIGGQQNAVLVNKADSNIEKLLKWIAKRINVYPGVNIQNFTSSWKDGIALCALMHYFLGDDVINPENVSETDAQKNFEYALKAGEDAGVPPLLKAEEMANATELDRRSMVTYLHTVYKILFADKQEKKETTT